MNIHIYIYPLQSLTGWWFQTFFIFTLFFWGDDPISRQYFSNLSIHFPKNTLTLAPWRTLKYKLIFWVNWLWRLSTYTYFWRGGMLRGGRLTRHKLGTLLIHFAMLIIPSCWVFSFFFVWGVNNRVPLRASRAASRQHVRASPGVVSGHGGRWTISNNWTQMVVHGLVS